MSAAEVLQSYESKLTHLRRCLAATQAKSLRLGLVLALAVLWLVVTGLRAQREQTSWVWPMAAVPVAVVAGESYFKNRRQQARHWRCVWHYERAIKRLQWGWMSTDTPTGPDPDANHLYANDLHLFGRGSLFQLLNTVRTSMGRARLAETLLTVKHSDQTILRQQAIRELEPNDELREALAALGEYECSDSNWDTFSQWLESPPQAPSQALRIVCFASSLLVIVVCLCGVAGMLTWSQFERLAAGPLLIQFVAGWRSRPWVREQLTRLRGMAPELKTLSQGLQLVESQRFSSPHLLAFTAAVKGSPRVILRLHRWLRALEERNKEWFYAPSILLMAATQLCWAIESWRIQYGRRLRRCAEVWAEFEVLNSLATYAHENPDTVYPSFEPGHALYEAEGLGHPLIDPERCVRNDVRFNSTTRLLLISGSNMAGKSTLLRAIGLSLVLAFAGAPVRARSLRLSPLLLCASISVVDSLAEGKSKFMAEIDRLRRGLEAAQGEVPVLFLVDEILAGTNSRDRRAASEAIVRSWIQRGAIGAISTHDLALTELAQMPDLCGSNVHMGSRDGTDPMDFDYLLKPGVTQESNALAIARMAGVA